MLFFKTSAPKNYLGIYWGKDAFSLAQSAKGQIDKTAFLRFDAPLVGDQGQKIPDSIRFTALLQQVIRDKKFTSKSVVLCLSPKDVIYRSFVIPFMQPSEVKNVVDFEATKYIPIKLEDLSYTYHAIAFTEGDQKNLRILFVAVRKSVVERYSGILQQAGLEMEFIEPASVSLGRVLQKLGHIPRQQASGIIEIDNDGGRITVIDKDIIQFVREFQSTVEGSGSVAENTKFINDVRVALNFYQRQNPQGKIDLLTIVSENDLTALASGLSQEFKIPATATTLQKILKNPPTKDLGILNACGSSLRDTGVSSKNFDLKVKSPSGKIGADTQNLLTNWNLKLLFSSLAISIGMVYATSLFTTALLSANTQKHKALTQQLAIYESSSKDKLEELKTEAEKKLNQYKDIGTTSEVAMYLQKLPVMIPKGAWLGSLSIDYDAAKKVSINMDGYVYLPDTDEQIRQVNILWAQLKNDTDFKKLFENIILTNVARDNFKNYPVTHFHINLK